MKIYKKTIKTIYSSAKTAIFFVVFIFVRPKVRKSENLL